LNLTGLKDKHERREKMFREHQFAFTRKNWAQNHFSMEKLAWQKHG